MMEESGLSLPTLCPRGLSLVLQSLETEFFGEEKQQIQIKVSWGANLKRRYIVLVFKINKDVMSFFFPTHCSMCDWISVSDHMMMLFRSFVYVYLIIIVLCMVIMVWGRYNLFCRSLGLRGARRGLKRKLGPAFSLSGVDLSHLWNLLIYAF